MYCVLTFQRPDAVGVIADYSDVKIFGPFETENLANVWVTIKEQEWEHARFLILEVTAPRVEVVAPAETSPPLAERTVEMKGVAHLRRTFREQLRRELTFNRYDEAACKRVAYALEGQWVCTDTFDDDSQTFTGVLVGDRGGDLLAHVPANDEEQSRFLAQERAWAIANAAGVIFQFQRLVSGSDWPRLGRF
jgi:hypothetical protein